MKVENRWESPEYLHQGHGFCPGCGFIVAFRHILKEMGADTILAVTAGCLGTNSGMLPASPIKVPAYNTPFASAAAAGTGIRAALTAQGNDHTQVLAIGGDGGTFDIGLQALSAAAERNEDFIYLCYDNEAYMNTGVQRSSATPFGALTTTTPKGDSATPFGALTTTTPKGDTKDRPKKNLAAIMEAHGIPYIATASAAYPEDLLAKIRTAKNIRGMRFLYILSPCPPGWGFSAELSIKLARMAVQAKIFPLYEIFDGERIVLNLEPPSVPLKDYIDTQGRFQYFSEEEIQKMQAEVDRNYEKFKTRVTQEKPAGQPGIV
jgi:pyruvate ferredoxin oxidoreductase beta subunit/2-oxoisovalerate ferredoxin oxidoreductase beta subunit